MDFEFELINIQVFNYTDFLYSDKPEEVILSILADFGNEKAEQVIEKVLTEIKNSSNRKFEIPKSPLYN